MTSEPTIIHSATLIDNGLERANSWIAFDGGIITRTGTGTDWRQLMADDPGYDVVDATGYILTPGFIDIHTHGGAGHNFDEGSAAFDAAIRMHRSRGTTRLVISLVTNPLDTMVALTEQVASRAAVDHHVLGVHLEGPFLSALHKGAHNERLLHAATTAELDRLLKAANGYLRQITLAPELDGGLDAVRHMVTNGVAVAVGHSDASYEQTTEAFEAGASILTHAFNGMNGIHHRAPGPVLAAFDHDGVTLEVIADGIHLRPEVISMVFGQAPGRVALITDAMAATGVGDGHYTLGELDVTVTDGVARLTEGGSIAGSTLTLDQALRTAVLRSGVSLPNAVTALTSAPARALGVDDRLGHLQPGYAADAVLLTPELEVARVWAAGVEA
ncbi:N-acetylglucosamine-6-phosphate deacetylase [Lysinibacter cavernae]|uniref:N-acetylglucosamine-6-phosphate deacetylase n=1 Tax=Lysinibacter cavernae TaxID=1640652 RepID=A0A7X5TTZ5_9MICO|nr:N-acetylglucosamine-6-phosphate deacetylase [Lysinibacter cavernae]NIH53828.1 N-acetylglucosamine-6-phosphate deacetylase [Lysinibacter cavernae]